MKTRRLVAATLAAALGAATLMVSASPASATTCEWHERHGGSAPWCDKDKPKPTRPPKTTVTTEAPTTTVKVSPSTTVAPSTTKAPTTTVKKAEDKKPTPVKVSPRFTG